MFTLGQWYKFFRMTNVLIILITFYLIRILVVVPLAKVHGLELVFNDWHFMIWAIVTVLAAIAGNIINDIYDVEIDQINKPDKVFINQLISKKNAWRLYFSLNALASFLVLWLYYQIDWSLIWVYPVVFFLAWIVLWLYSYRYKKSVLTGNIIVAIFVSFVPWSVCYPELVKVLNDVVIYEPFFVFTSIIYILFGFISTVLREIIKDIEDKDGDAQFGGRTLPIVCGVTAAKRIGQIFGILLLGLMSFSVYLLFIKNLAFSAVYGVLAVILPTIYLLISLEKAREKKRFHQLSQITKLIMMAGLIFLMVLYCEYY